MKKMESEREVKKVNLANLKRGDRLSVETLLGETIESFEIIITGKRKDGLRVNVKSKCGEEKKDFTARMPGGFTMNRGLTGCIKTESDGEQNCLFFENLKDAKTKEKISSSMRTTPIQKIKLEKK